MLFRLPVLIALLVGAALPRAAHAAFPVAGKRCIAVVGTNDLHGVIEPVTITVQSASVHSGGVIGTSAYVRALRQNYGKRMVLLDGGDLFQGTLASNLSDGKAIIDAYNLMGYDGSAIGNHEFDFGASPNNANDRLGIIKERIAQAQFPFLTLNVFERATGRRVAWPNTAASILRDVGGIKVGIIGATTVETPKVTRTQNVATLEFREPQPLLLEEAKALRRQGGELVVFVAHIGGRCTNLSNPHDLSTCDTTSHIAEIMRLLEGLPAGTVDVAVAGHTHQFMAHWINGTATIESGARGQHIAWVEACLDAKGKFDRDATVIHAPTDLCLETWSDGTCHKRKTPTAIQTARFLDAPVSPMPEVASAMRPYEAAVAALGQKNVGVNLPASLSANALTGIVAESMRRSMHADFGLQNRGGIRAELAAGPVTYGAIFNVLPFDNTVVSVKMTGRQVSDLFALLGKYKAGSPAFVGLLPCQDPLHDTVCNAKGTPLDANAFYTLATSDFLLEGGDGADAVFKHVPDADRQLSDLMMRDALIDLLSALYPAKG